MIVKHNAVEYTYISTIVKREYQYDDLYKDISYFVVHAESGHIEEIPVDCCEVKV